MYRHLFLNPFYWYAAIWSGVLLLYPLGWASAYEPLDPRLTAFFLATIALSLVLGFYFGRQLKRITLAYHPPRFPGVCAAVMLLGYAADFLYAGFVPLIAALTGSERTYKDFEGISVFHTLLLTFSLFFGAYMCYCFLHEKRRLCKWRYAAYIALVALMFLLLYNRASLMFLFFAFFVIFLASCRKIRAVHLLCCAAAALLLLFLFGVLGNMRHGSAWNDTSYLMAVAEIDAADVPAALPKPFLWAYVYIVTPLGNLNNLVLHYAPTRQSAGVIVCLIPDALGTRLLSDISSISLPLVISNLTVLSGFGPMYYFGGFLGMLTEFAYMTLLNCFCTRLSLERARYIDSVGALCCTVTAFLFFDNFLNYTGILFALVYPLAATVWDLIGRHRRPSRYPSLLPLRPSLPLPRRARSVGQEP